MYLIVKLLVFNDLLIIYGLKMNNFIKFDIIIYKPFNTKNYGIIS